MEDIIKVRNINKQYKIFQKEEGLKGSLKSLVNRKYDNKIAVDNISFNIKEGEFIGFIGPNGAGKTTTIKMLSGIIHPDSGEIKVMGFTPHKLLDKFKMNFSVIMGQKNQLWWDIPAIDSFKLYKEVYRIPKDQFQKNLDELTTVLDVKHVLNVPVRNLSLGERMKLEIIGALLHDPKVIFMDEPTIGLDVFSRRSIRNFLKYINKERKVTIILTSHYIEDIKILCDRIIAIQKGTIIHDGSFNEISQEVLDCKQVTVHFEKRNRHVNIEKYGQLVENEGNKGVFLIKKSMLKEFIKTIFTTEEVCDLNIEDVPVDEVFEKLFNTSKRDDEI